MMPAADKQAGAQFNDSLPARSTYTRHPRRLAPHPVGDAAKIFGDDIELI